MVEEFGVTLDQVNWLGTIVGCVYLPTAILIPTIVSKYGIRRCVRDIHRITLLNMLLIWLSPLESVLSEQLHYFSLRGYGMLGLRVPFQVNMHMPSSSLDKWVLLDLRKSTPIFSLWYKSFASIAQPIYQILAPKYSETWFDLRGRTTATMIIAICESRTSGHLGYSHEQWSSQPYWGSFGPTH